MTRIAMGLATICLAAAACGGGTTPPPAGPGQSPGGAPTQPPSAGAGGQGNGSSSANGYEGKLTTSGLYDASWTVAPGAVEVFNAAANPSLISDKGTFANVKVGTDGAVSFGSGADALTGHGNFKGGGAQVTLDASGAFVCAFTVDTDLVGSDGAKLHLAGQMTVHWHPEGLGDLNCP